mgnify:CR=1 FL=1
MPPASKTSIIALRRRIRGINIVTARQRDLKDFLGEHVPGAERLAFGETFRWWEDRFNKITDEIAQHAQRPGRHAGGGLPRAGALEGVPDGDARPGRQRLRLAAHPRVERHAAKIRRYNREGVCTVFKPLAKERVVGYVHPYPVRR